jgi:glycogen synthase
MYVVMVSAECAPAIKSGGLGDMVSSLSRELELRGHTVEVILPKYSGQFVLIGDAHHHDRINGHFWQLKHHLNENPDYHTDNQAIESALGRALRLWAARPGDFRTLAATCIRADYSWAQPARDYLHIYRWIRHK